MATKPATVAPKTTVSKMEAVRQALSKLTKNAMPVDIQTFIKNTFGIAMTTAHISNYKTDILRKAAGKSANKSSKPAIAKPMAKAPPAPTAVAKAPSVPAPKASTSGISLQDIEMVKSLLARVGPGSLKALIDLLG